MNSDLHDSIRAIQWNGNTLRLLDQRVLPQDEVYLELRTAVETARAIADMVVRGAPAIGITAAYGVVLAIQDRFATHGREWGAAIEGDLALLAASRPTAVNLFWALNRMRAAIAEQASVEEIEALARRIHEEDIAANRLMGELGAGLIAAPSGVLTHCNTGSLATGGFGTALGVIRTAFTAGKISSVYADETRPWLQGARLTAWELVRDGIPVRLLADGAAAALLRTGDVQWVIVGADRIAANGDVANKIGTYATAIAARHHGVRFMAVAPSSTVDMNTPDGSRIPIEMRDENELLMAGGQRVAAAGAGAWNPVFDVTPASLIDAIVTERGVVERPDTLRMEAMMGSIASDEP